MGKPSIGYDNFFEHSGATVSTSSEAVGFEKEKAYDWFAFDAWKPAAAGAQSITVDLGSAKEADYWAVFGYKELVTNGGSIKPQYSTDNFGANIVDFDSAQSPTAAGVIFRTVTPSQTKRYWRFLVTSTPVSAIAAVLIGKRLDLDADIRGRLDPPNLQANSEPRINRSQTGQNLGHSEITTGIEMRASFDAVSPSWARTNWPAFRTHANKKPFVFSWDAANFPNEAAFVWLDAKATKDPAYTHPMFMSMTLAMNGLRE